MERISFFNYYGFSYFGASEVGDFNIITDLLVPQSSTFECISEDALFTQGMVAVFGYGYIGIVSKAVKEPSTGKITVTCKDISSILDIQVSSDARSSISFGAYVLSMVNQYLKSSSDSFQNISWLTIVNNSTCTGATPAYAANTSKSMLDVISDIQNISGLGIKFSMLSGNSGIQLTIYDRADYTPIRVTDSIFSDLSYSFDHTTSVNKIIMLPNSDNYLYQTEFDYYLLSDGTVTTDSADSKRITPVVYEIMRYTDSQCYSDQLASTAAESLTAGTYSHSISLKMHKNASKIDELNSLYSSIITGTKVLLYGINSDGSGLKTVVTQIERSSSDEIKVTCGYQRSSLTDKMKMAQRAVDGSNSINYVNYKVVQSSNYNSKTYAFAAGGGSISASLSVTLIAGASYVDNSLLINDGSLYVGLTWTTPVITKTYSSSTMQWTVSAAFTLNYSGDAAINVPCKLTVNFSKLAT